MGQVGLDGTTIARFARAAGPDALLVKATSRHSKPARSSRTSTAAGTRASPAPPRIKAVQHDPDRLLIRCPVPAGERVPTSFMQTSETYMIRRHARDYQKCDFVLLVTCHTKRATPEHAGALAERHG
jgi:hypothetical protein